MTYYLTTSVLSAIGTIFKIRNLSI